MIKRIIAGALSAVICTSAAAADMGTQAFSDYDGTEAVAAADEMTVSDDAEKETAEDEAADISEVITDGGETAPEEAQPVDTVELGENISAEVFDNGYVHIKGSGDMNDFKSSPFKDMAVKRVFIENESDDDDLVITSLGKNVFNGCDELTALGGKSELTENIIDIPDSITKIGEAAFAECSAVKDVKLGSGVKTVGSYAFKDCTGLTTFIVPANVESMGKMMLIGCTELTELVLPYAATAASCAMEKGSTNPDCSVADLFMDQNWNWENDRMDFSTYKLTKVTVTGGEKVPRSAFSGMTGLKEIDLSGTSAVAIDEYAFYKCSALSDIRFPATLKNIGRFAFADCTSIKEMSLNEGVEKIGEYALMNCTGLTSFEVPDSVLSMGKMMFNGCTEITEISLPYAATNAECTKRKSDTNPDNSVADLFIDQNWNWENDKMDFSPYKLTKVTIRGGEKIPRNAFSGMTGLTEVDFSGPELYSVDMYAFYNCTSLADIKISAAVDTIGDYAYCNTPITALPDNGRIKKIGEGAFADCKNLEISTVPKSYEEIGKYAFRGCTGIKTFTVPDSVIRIGKMSFNGCTELTELTMAYASTERACGYIKLPTNPDCSVADLFIDQNWNWENDKMDFSPYKLTKVTITGGEKVPMYAFSGMTGLNEIDLSGSSLSVIEDHAFLNCTSLSELKLPTTLKTINNNAFSNCCSITEFVLPDGLEYIGAYAFEKCTGINSIAVPDTVTEMGKAIFNECRALETVKLPYAAAKADCVKAGGAVNPDQAVSDLFIDQNWNWENDKMDFSGYAVSKIIITGGERIPEYAFANMTSLKEVDICSSGVSDICGNAFLNCSALVSAEIPETVTAIGGAAFAGSAPDLYIYGKDCKLSDDTLDGDYGGTVYGYTNSTANTYADENEFKFVPIDGETVIGPKSISMTVGDKYTVKTGVEGAVFKSADESIATVDEKGIISAEAVGNTIVEVLDSIGGSVEIDVSVRAHVTVLTTTTVTTTTAEDTETTTTTTAEPVTEPVTEPTEPDYVLGDVDANGKINAVDASMILSEYAVMSTKGISELDDTQKKAADVTNDGKINAIDATTVLTYYAYTSTHGGEALSMEEFLEKDE